jgi:hypothetical protein
VVEDDAFSVNVLPLQMGLLLVMVGVAGVAFTVTSTVAAGDVQPASLTLTLYVPAAKTVAFDMLGFCVGLLKEFGPDH